MKKKKIELDRIKALIPRLKKATQKENNSPEQAEIYSLPLMESHKNQANSDKTYGTTRSRLMQVPWLQLSLWELIRALLSWFTGPCSPGVVYPLQFLKSVLALFPEIANHWGEAPSVGGTTNLYYHYIHLAVVLCICSYVPPEKPIWQWLDRALISEYGGIILSRNHFI